MCARILLGLLMLALGQAAYAAQIPDLDESVQVYLDSKFGSLGLGIFSALKQQWELGPTLRKIVQTPRSTLYSIKPESTPGAPPSWAKLLQSYLADDNLSLEMTDDDLIEWTKYPDSIKFKIIDKVFPTIEPYQIYNAFGMDGMFTIYDLMKAFANQESFDRYIDRVGAQSLASARGLGPLTIAEMKRYFAQAVAQYRAELEMRPTDFLSQFSLELASKLTAAGIVQQDNLRQFSDKELTEFLDHDMSLISELYLYMKPRGLYDSPARCLRMF